MILPRILIVPGSCRAGSHSTRLAAAAHKVFSTLECEATRISLGDYPMPIYNGDLEDKKGPPDNAFKLARLFHASDGVLLVTPEYNASVPPLLKNTLDWISRISEDKKGPVSPYKNTLFALASSSLGGLGGIRSLSHLRDILTNVGATVIAEQTAVGHVGKAFDDMEALTTEPAKSLLDSGCASLVNSAKLLSVNQLRG